MSDDQSEIEQNPFMENNYKRDWECRDCGIIYCADVDATSADLPDMCADCGDHRGWRNKKTGRVL